MDQIEYKRKSAGFTLIELLIYTSVFVIAAGFLTAILVNTSRVESVELVSTQVGQELNLVLTTVQRLVRDASLIECVGADNETCSTSTAPGPFLRLRFEGQTKDPTCVYLDNGVVKLAEGPKPAEGPNPEKKEYCNTTAATDLTTDKVTASTLTFTKFDIPGGHATVQIEAQLTFKSSKPELQISKTLRSAVGRVSAATFDSDLLPDVNNSRSIGSITGPRQWKDGRFSNDLTIGGNVGIGTTNPNNLIQVANLINFDDTDFNTKLGYQAGGNIVSGAQYNTFVGYQAGLAASVGGTLAADDNTAIGYQALFDNTTGVSNTALGASALYSNTAGLSNVALGTYALNRNTVGNYNTALGVIALYSNTAGNANIALGFGALFSNTTGIQNTALGVDALYDLDIIDGTGNNTVIGYNTGGGIVTGVNNTILGANVIGLAAALSNNIIIADGAGNRRINVDSAGNVGIGTALPTDKLSIKDSTDPTIALANTALNQEQSGRISFGEENYSDLMYIQYHGNTDERISINSDSYTDILTVSRNSGNVGIRTTTPLAPVEIVGPAAASIGDSAHVLDLARPYVPGTAYATSASFKLANPGFAVPYTRLDIALLNTGQTSDTLPDTTVMSLLSNGNVGIGTTGPNSKFQVVGGDAAVTTQGNGVILRATDGTNCYRVTVNNAGTLATTLVACP